MAVSWFWHDCALVLSWQTLYFGPRSWHMLKCLHLSRPADTANIMQSHQCPQWSWSFFLSASGSQSAQSVCKNDCGWMSFDWVLIFPNDRTNAKYMLNICFLCAAYICTGPRRQICEVYPLENQTPGAEFDSYEFQPFVVLILFFIISRSILGACG